MKLEMPLRDGLVVVFDDYAPGEPGYPTGRLQKGLTVFDGGEQLAEEGVGFGVPVLKLGVRTVFAGRAEADWRRRRDGSYELDVVYMMDLVERLSRPSGARVRSAPLYATKDSLAALHRRSPRLRGALTLTSAAVRRVFRLETVYEQIAPCARVPVSYTVAADGRIAIAADLSHLSDEVTEAVVMNELGGRLFDICEDADRSVLRGDEIGTWDQVEAARSGFVCERHDLLFSVGQAEGAQLYRGREVIGSRLSWSGFGYSIARPRGVFRYDLMVARRA